MIDDVQIAAMQRFAHKITAIPSGIHLPSGLAVLAGWRWFIDDACIVFEPPTGSISPRAMIFLDMHTRTTDVEAVFRATPISGVYLRCKLAVESVEEPAASDRRS